LQRLRRGTSLTPFWKEFAISRRCRGSPILAAASVFALLSALTCRPFADVMSISGEQMAYLALFGRMNSALGIALFTLGSRRLLRKISRFLPWIATRTPAILPPEFNPHSNHHTRWRRIWPASSMRASPN